MKIKIIGNAITKDEQLDIARLLVKAGYTVNIEKGKSEDRKSVAYINYTVGGSQDVEKL